MYGIRKIIPSALQHPTAKPVELAAAFIRWHTEIGDIVLDPFCGAGSCLEAALRMGRKYIGVELDAHWAEVARNRLANTERPLFTKETQDADA
jgi:site-specific DNA-methyltransferase (adenine-specific)